MSIQVKNITKLYGEQKALNNVSFQIKSGEIVGFLGPNGAGKSTMMKIITGFIPPTDGEVFVNGIDILNADDDVRKNIGYLPEHNPLYLDMYVREYLEFTGRIYKLGKQLKNRVNEVIGITGLTPESKKKIGALSKGYRQRVGLAQALIHDPDVLILDEPTSGLDPNQIVEIRNLIAEAGQQKTVMLSTHIMQEVEAICDRIIIVNKGQVVANDSTSDIKDKAKDAYQTILVEFDNQLESTDFDELNEIDKVAKLENNMWLLQTSSTEDIRGVIFNFAVKKGYTVLNLTKKEKSLEEVFQELTK